MLVPRRFQDLNADSPMLAEVLRSSWQGWFEGSPLHSFPSSPKNVSPGLVLTKNPLAPFNPEPNRASRRRMRESDKKTTTCEKRGRLIWQKCHEGSNRTSTPKKEGEREREREKATNTTQIQANHTQTTHNTHKPKPTHTHKPHLIFDFSRPKFFSFFGNGKRLEFEFHVVAMLFQFQGILCVRVGRGRGGFKALPLDPCPPPLPQAPLDSGSPLSRTQGTPIFFPTRLGCCCFFFFFLCATVEKEGTGP